MGKPQEDLRDVQFIRDDLARFGSMTFEQMAEHWDKHPEDRLQMVYLPNRSHRPISRDAAVRFASIAERHRKILASGSAIDLRAFDRAIREEFVDAFVVQDHPTERKWIDRMLNRAVTKTTATHQEKTHYLPCVLVEPPTPPEFRVGPVRFIVKEKFLTEFWTKIEDDHRASHDEKREYFARLVAEGGYPSSQLRSPEQWAETRKIILDRLLEYFSRFSWIAEVAVPPCDSEVSKDRAEKAVQGSLDLLKLCFGPRGERFRLGDSAGRPSLTAGLVRDAAGSFHSSFAERGDGELASEGWYDDLLKNGDWALAMGGAALHGYLSPESRSDHRDRWLDALNWYGQAVVEPLDSAQLVKFVAALERLTVTDASDVEAATDVVTRRTALLVGDDPGRVAEVRQEMRKIYRWRSLLMHGRSSPLTPELGSVMNSVMRTAREIVPQALFRALELLWVMDYTGEQTSDELEKRFVELEKSLPQRPESPLRRLVSFFRSALRRFLHR